MRPRDVHFVRSKKWQQSSTGMSPQLNSTSDSDCIYGRSPLTRFFPYLARFDHTPVTTVPHLKVRHHKQNSTATLRRSVPQVNPRFPGGHNCSTRIFNRVLFNSHHLYIQIQAPNPSNSPLRSSNTTLFSISYI